MGSATTQALAASTAALDAASDVDLGVAGELFAAGRALADTPQLSGALADWGASDHARATVVASVFQSLGQTSRALLDTVARERWSSASDLVDAVEELAIRAAAAADTSADVEGELFRFARIVAGDPQLELALGSRLGDPDEKGRLVATLLSSRASAATTLIASSVVQRPRERRVRELLARAERIVASARGRAVATVTSAVPLGAAQIDRIAAMLKAKYDADVSVNTVVDPTLVGGLRVQIADDVIDATVASRLSDLRHRLAG
ncbi:F0F1 ATP synthase subunit delta [Microbacterium sp. SYP-A9085]|uniref:F0F1 ATP synthase subunit delta n=1 Tax=Microbacterium sp. SYP-A9085 TaxID=2664454 RepID=UPI00129B24B2|nr:F0F1 ATP synthase subunit delta [Microbacterium sp. SYP-A9085]MRH29352.1 F0F1 ATP synthase subunit delta [Microbacterium sp. SYP-A9085]